MLFATMITMFATPSFAQLYIGVQGGVGIASQSWDLKKRADPSAELTFSSLTGITGGLMVRYNLTKNIGIQGELNYLRKGSHMLSSVNMSEYDTLIGNTDFSFNYIEIPVMFCYTLPSVLPMLDVNFLAGPSIGFYESGRSNVSTILSSTGQNSQVDFEELIFKKNVRSPDFGITAGIGTTLNLSPSLSFMLTGRYLFGLTNIVVDVPPPPSPISIGATAARNRTIIIMAGAALRL